MKLALSLIDKEVNVKKKHKKTVTLGHESSIRGNPPIHGADSCLDLTYGQNEKLRFECFPYGTNNWLPRDLLYSYHERVEKFSENL